MSKAIGALARCCLLPLVCLAACGGAEDVELDRDGAANGDGGILDAPWVSFADADPNAPDAGPNAGCSPTGVACNNCIDDDGDGLIDGFDPHCTSALDDDEATFATGIPGDNKDPRKQDCFFDGNSGAGDDKCDIHACCLLDTCPPELQGQYDPASCDTAVTQECINNCGPLTPPGCDCFSCCTICDADNNCADVFTNPAVAPDCDVDVLDDPDKCPPCTKISECSSGECNSLECILCPGQTTDDLPAECSGGNTCPGDATPCATTNDCLDNQFCSAGCCIHAID